MNYSKFLTPTSLARKANAIRILTAIALKAGPSMISLAGGLPNPATFPFKEASFKMWNGDSLHFNEDRMKMALQYSASNGLPEFLSTLSEIQNYWHSSTQHLTPNNLCVTYGSTEAVSKCLEMLMTPGDGILLEQPTNPSVLKALKSLGCNLLAIPSDKEGIIPSEIHKACQAFNTDNKENSGDKDKNNKYKNNNISNVNNKNNNNVINNGNNNDGTNNDDINNNDNINNNNDDINNNNNDNINNNNDNINNNNSNVGRIKCLYTSTCLPSTSLQRRRQVLKLASEKDFLILEHDPFFFLTPSQNKVPSYLSMDTEGRVLRIDSFSHIFSPGMRVGVVTGAEELVNRVVLHVMVSTMHCPSINQLMLNEVMEEMKTEGFNNFCQILTDHYDVRRRIAEKAANQHLSEFFEWEIPKTAFTMCLRLKETQKVNLSELLEDLEKQKVYFSNGKDCYIAESQHNEVLFSFGFCDEEDIAKGCEILGKTTRQHSSWNFISSNR